MTLNEIKKNITNLESIDKKTLEQYIQTLYMRERKQNNKIIVLQGQLKNHQKKVNKIVALLNKVFDGEEPAKQWSNKK